MITQLNGRLVSKTPTTIVVDCNGVGYEVNISLNTYGQLPEDELICIYTHMQVREDAQNLYGFMEKVERSVFRLLLSLYGLHHFLWVHGRKHRSCCIGTYPTDTE